MTIEIRPTAPGELRDALIPISVAFGFDMTEERVALASTLTERDRGFGAFDHGAIVGSVSSYTFAMTVPGGAAIPTACTTMVGVLPTHRRRGILRNLMRTYLEDAHARGQPLAALFASEAGIYGRFGYGVASFAADIHLDHAFTAFAHRPDHTLEPEGQVRLISEAEALTLLPPIWERVRPHTPGMMSRTPAWWTARRIGDHPWMRQGRGPLQRVLLELDGRPAAYALYRCTLQDHPGGPSVDVDVSEAIGDSPRATRAIWRYLVELDLLRTLKAGLLPIDHPLLFLLNEPRRLGMTLEDGLWVRLVDVSAALTARTYAPGEAVTFQVDDRFCPWNHGTWKLDDGTVTRTHEVADLALPVEALGAVYLGGVSFDQLVAAGRVTELRPGAAARADRLFLRGRAPWCPDMF